jgi:hypothetical protein
MSSTVIWLDPSLLEKNESYYDKLKSLNIYEIKQVKTVKEAMEEIYKKVFEDVFIIVNGSLFLEFHNKLKNNLDKICIIPKIVIFTESNKEAYINSLGDNKKIIYDKFYNIGGIKTDYNEVIKFIKTPEMNEYKLLLDKNDEEYLNFDYIDNKEKLLLPLFYKFLIKFTERDNQFNNYLYKKYYNKSKAIKRFLDSISNFPNLPIQILSKYYVRIYTDEDSRFYSDLNKSLRKGKKEKFLPYIKILYEGIRLEALPYSKDEELYRGCILPKKEIEKIYEYKNKGAIKGLPGAIVFSKTFLSFTKDKDMAYYFINNNQNSSNEKCRKVLFILKREINIDYNTSTHVDAEKLSLISTEREVLFFPFSSFEIKEINLNKEKNIYEIKLLYLAKYFDQYKEELTKFPKIIPDSEYKNELIKSKLIEINDIESIDSSKLNKIIDNYYSIDDKSNLSNKIPTNLQNLYNIRKFNLDKINQDYTIPNPSLALVTYPTIDIKENYITGYFLITDKDLYQNIRIINSFEESKRRYNYIKVQNELKYNNEKEITSYILLSFHE